jgi:hypothetical protein
LAWRGDRGERAARCEVTDSQSGGGPQARGYSFDLEACREEAAKQRAEEARQAVERGIRKRQASSRKANKSPKSKRQDSFDSFDPERKPKAAAGGEGALRPFFLGLASDFG